MIYSKGITIDSKTSRDLDDAIWAETTKDGYKISTLITDVTKTVAKNSSIDLIAKEKTASQYYSNYRVDSMIPKNISEGKSSLLKGKVRDVLHFEISLDKSFNFLNFQVTKKVFVNKNRLSHIDVESILKSPNHAIKSTIELCYFLSKSLLEERSAKGALAYYDLDSRLALSEEGTVIHLPKHKANVGYLIVQEFMILTNQACALYFAQNNIPALYRNHKRKQNAPKQKDLKQSINGLDHIDLNHIANKINLVVEKARTSPFLIGHYGLNIDAYCHVTSPLRRYADLVNQRVLLSLIERRPPPYTQDELTTISNKINNHTDNISEKKSLLMKGNSLSRARSMINTERLSEINKGDLYSFFKSSIERKQLIPIEVTREVANRISKGEDSIMKCLGILVYYQKDLLDKESIKVILPACSIQKAFITSLFSHLEMKYTLPYSLSVNQIGENKWSASASTVFHNLNHTVTHNWNGKKSSGTQATLYRLLCSMMGFNEINEFEEEHKEIVTPANYKGELFEKCAKFGLPSPVVNSKQIDSGFESVIYITSKNKIKGSGYGSSKIESQQRAALSILKNPDFINLNLDRYKKYVPPENPISALQEYCQRMKLRMPIYVFYEIKSGFRCEVSQGDFSTSSESTSKKEAKQLAASNLLQLMDN